LKRYKNTNKSGEIILKEYLPISYKKLNIKIYKTVIVPIVLYGCETWFLSEERRLRDFGKTVLRTFEPKRKEDGSWRKLHEDEFTACILP
jgi:hypothetical protein